MTDEKKPEGKTLLQQFDEELAAINMRGQWQYDGLLEKVIGGPPPAGVAHIWPWELLQENLLKACEAMPESFTARRNLSFLNPAIERGGTTQTILMGIQMVRPGEVAWAHRHSIAAIRFVVQGHPDLYTVVDGEKQPMESYDLVLTPQWAWHDHHNESTQDAIWIDILDVPFVLGLNQPFYEPYGEATQPLRERQADHLDARADLLRPAWERLKTENIPFRYAWKDVLPQLERLADAEGSPYDGVVLDYVNPMTGGPTLPTLGCCVQMLRPGEETKPHRHTSSAVYFVVRGEGTTTVDGKEINWKQHDAFVVPNWSWHHHANGSKDNDAILFSANDIPILQPFGLYLEEPEVSLAAARPPLVPADGSRK
ncbi:MAG: cupin domain-containing protein [Alphaproteobacteria bacterium]